MKPRLCEIPSPETRAKTVEEAELYDKDLFIAPGLFEQNDP